jgi:hypothetical protein
MRNSTSKNGDTLIPKNGDILITRQQTRFFWNQRYEQCFVDVGEPITVIDILAGFKGSPGFEQYVTVFWNGELYDVNESFLTNKYFKLV